MKKNNKETDIVIAQPVKTPTSVTARRTEFFELSPKEQVIHATEIANVLSDVIEKQSLFQLIPNQITGKKYIKAEGWQTLGTLLGIVPKEAWVKRHDNGTYEAFVELVKFRDGTIVGGASAICSRSERQWSGRDEYAIRSMAITRATGKAYRTSFAWIVTLAGYEPTPSEEMPPEDKQNSDKQPEVQAKQEPQAGQTMNVSAKKQGYNPQSKAHQDALIKVLKARNIPEDIYDDVGNAMAGKSMEDLPTIIAECNRSVSAGSV